MEGGLGLEEDDFGLGMGEGMPPPVGGLQDDTAAPPSATVVFNTLFLPTALPSRHEDVFGDRLLDFVGGFLDANAKDTKKAPAWYNVHAEKRAASIRVKIAKPGEEAKCVEKFMRDFVAVESSFGGASGGSTLHGKLRRLQVGHYLGFHVRAQNCVVVVKRMDQRSARVALWTAECSHEEAMQIDHLYHRTPEHLFSCRWDQLTSEAFADLVVELRNNRLAKAAAPPAGKKGAVHGRNLDDEEFDGADHEANAGDAAGGLRVKTHGTAITYVRDFLFGGAIQGDAVETAADTLVDAGMEMELDDPSSALGTGTGAPSEGDLLTKKVRDQVRKDDTDGENKSHWRRSPFWFVFRSAVHYVSQDVFGDSFWYKATILAMHTHALEEEVEKAEVNEECALRLSGFHEAIEKIRRRREKLALELVEKMAAHHPKVCKNAGPVFANKSAPPSVRAGELVKAEGCGVQRTSKLGPIASYPRIYAACDMLVNSAVSSGKQYVESREDAARSEVVVESAGVRLTRDEAQRDRSQYLERGGAEIARLAQELTRDAADGGGAGASFVLTDAVRDSGTARAVARERSALPDAKNRDEVDGLLSGLCYDLGLLQHGARGSAIGDGAVVLCDVERLVAHLWGKGAVDFSGPELCGLLEKYMKVALQYGKGCFRARSHVVLCALTAVLLLDRRACHLHSVVKRHGIDIPESLCDVLFLETEAQRKQLQSIEEYLKQRRPVFYQQHDHDGLAEVPDRDRLLCDNVTHNSLCVRFYDQDQKMKQKRTAIENACAQKAEAKRVALATARERAEACQRRINSSYCTCNFYICKNGRRGRRLTRLQDCTKCVNQQERDGMRFHPHVRLLPNGDLQQKAIVFELLKPEAIDTLEKALVTFARHLLQPTNDYLPVDRFIPWSTDSALVSFSENFAALTSGRAAPLGSTHQYSRSPQGMDPLLAQHVIDNVGNVKPGILMPTERSTAAQYTHQFTRGCGRLQPMGSWNWSTLGSQLSVSLLTNRYPKEQQFFLSCEHAKENNMIARQSEAYADRSDASKTVELREFVDYGLLRAGHHLQLVRLVQMLDARTLDFNNQDVYSLVTAALWQVCQRLGQNAGAGASSPIADTPGIQSWFREPVAMLGEAGFVLDLLRAVESLLATARENWEMRVKVLLVISVARLVYEHLPRQGGPVDLQNARKQCVRLIKDARGVLLAWLRKLRDAAALSTDDAEMQALRTKLLEVSTAACLTFAGDSDLLSASTTKTAFSAEEADSSTRKEVVAGDLVDWFFVRATFRDNVSSAALADSWLRRQILAAESIAQQVYDHVTAYLLKNWGDSFRTSLDAFLHQYWSGATCLGHTYTESDGMAQKEIKSGWRFNPGKPRWLRTRLQDPQHPNDDSRDRLLEMDVIGGTFLVNGDPCTRLPAEVVNHPDYSRIFGKAIFLVHPIGGGTYKTCMKLQGASFLFRSRGLDGAPLIMEEREMENGEARRSVYISPEHFRPDKGVSSYCADFPATLIENYGHWITAEGDAGDDWELLFRPIQYTHPDFATRCDLTLDGRTKVLHDSRVGYDMIDMHSPTCRTLHASVFARLAPAEDVLCYYCAPQMIDIMGGLDEVEGDSVEHKDAIAMLQFPRLRNIRFFVDDLPLMPALMDAASPVRGSQRQDDPLGLGVGAFADGVFGGEEEEAGVAAKLAAGNSLSQNAARPQRHEEFNKVYSPEFQNFEVCCEHSCGTLHGLTAGLLLVPPPPADGGVSTQDRILVVPHTRGVTRQEDGRVLLDTAKIYDEPSFFRYEVRDGLRDVVPPKERLATLYLALLHGLTSGITPDEHLGCTGTQQALKLLQSGRACGYMVATMPGTDSAEEDRLAKALLTEIHLLRKIACISISRSSTPDTGVFEMNNAWSATKHPLEPLAANGQFAFLVKQHLSELSLALELSGRPGLLVATEEEARTQRKATAQVRRDHPVLRVYGQEMWDELAELAKELKGRTGVLSGRALMRSFERHPALLRPSEEELSKMLELNGEGQLRGSRGPTKRPADASKFFAGQGAFLLPASHRVSETSLRALQQFYKVCREPKVLRTVQLEPLEDLLCPSEVGLKISTLTGRRMTECAVAAQAGAGPQPTLGAAYGVNSKGQLSRVAEVVRLAQAMMACEGGGENGDQLDDAEQDGADVGGNPGFAHLFIDLYLMALDAGRRNAPAANKARFQTLLAFLALEYPECKDTFLPLLLTVFFFSDGHNFPEPPRHTSYVRPHLQEFSDTKIFGLAAQYVHEFQDPEPERAQHKRPYYPYDTIYTETVEDFQNRRDVWEKRGKKYLAARKKFARAMQLRAEEVFDAGEQMDAVSHIEGCLWSTTLGCCHKNNEKVLEEDLVGAMGGGFHYSSETKDLVNMYRVADLASEINREFGNWRRAKEVQMFASQVSAKLAQVQQAIPQPGAAVVGAGAQKRSLEMAAATISRALASVAKPVRKTGRKNYFRLSRETMGLTLPEARRVLKSLPAVMESPTLEELLAESQVGNAASGRGGAASSKRRKLEQAADPELVQLPAVQSGQYQQLAKSFHAELAESLELASKQQGDSAANLYGPLLEKKSALLYLQKVHEQAQTAVESCWKKIEKYLVASTCGNAEAVTDVVQRYLMGESSDAGKKLLAQRFALLLRASQRASRCLSLYRKRQQHHLRVELENATLAYDPATYPSWLAFELENDLCIRPQQAKVAEALIGGNSNRVLQLDMGEGKTSVIVPIVVLALTSPSFLKAAELDGNTSIGKNAKSTGMKKAAAADASPPPEPAENTKPIVRLTVLSSLFATNASELQFKLGGVLGRRVVPQLSRRDLALSVKLLERTLERFDLARSRGDVVVTVPEYRLSATNKALEYAAACSSHYDQSGDLAAAARSVESFFDSHAREILDESDEILCPKYQLVYSLGAPNEMDGAMLRYQLSSFVLGVASRNALRLQKKFGTDVVEIMRTATGGSCETSYEYSGVRLLEHGKLKNAFDELRHLCLDELLATNKVKLTGKEVAQFRKAVLEQELQVVGGAAGMAGSSSVLNHGGGGNSNATATLFDGFEDDTRKIGQILRGFLTFEVLEVVLKKRWRVEFGAHPTRPTYQLAAPFVAKDKASEKSEFAHPDILVLLTTVNYYNSGLSEKGVEAVFRKLNSLAASEADSLYAKWAGEVNGTADSGVVPEARSGVNLEDKTLMQTVIFPNFRRHMRVVDFWLHRMIFPAQLRQFPQKLVATAWDLCKSAELCSSWKSVTQGFSGTDDTKIVLPGTIKQKNMEELKMTAGIQLKRFLRPENDEYRALQPEGTLGAGNSAEQILAEATNDEDVVVILDAGALVLQLQNKELCEKWLDGRPDKEFAVYYDNANTIVCLSRRTGEVTPFSLSPCAQDMSRALLYLDDAHCRGSDFRLPLTAKGILTLGKGMCKDKLLQSAMRLRQLGRGQRLTFIASREVDAQICHVGGGGAAAKTSSKSSSKAADRDRLKWVPAVLDWSLQNTYKRLSDLVPYYSAQCRTTLVKAAAFEQYEKSMEEMKARGAAEANEEEGVDGLGLLGGGLEPDPAPMRDDPETRTVLNYAAGKIQSGIPLEQVAKTIELLGRDCKLAKFDGVNAIKMTPGLAEKVNASLRAAVRNGKLAVGGPDLFLGDDLMGENGEIMEDMAGDPQEAREEVAEKCVEDEVLLLKDMYARSRSEHKLPEIVGKCLRRFLQSARDPNAMDVDGEEDALDDTKTGEFAQRILAGVEKLFPNVKRFAAGFDEEQERELEQELEEEVQVFRPPAAKPLPETKISNGLREFLENPNQRSPGGTHDPLLPLRTFVENCGQLSRLLPAGMFEFSQAAATVANTVLVSKNFVQTIAHVSGSFDNTFYLKQVRWLVWHGERRIAVLVSNFEAESCASRLLRSGGAAQSSLQLLPFVPVGRLGQKQNPDNHCFANLFRVAGLRDFRAHPAIHVCAGSIHLDLLQEASLGKKVLRYLCLVPRNVASLPPSGSKLTIAQKEKATRAQEKRWDLHLDAGSIARDGFVKIGSAGVWSEHERDGILKDVGVLTGSTGTVGMDSQWKNALRPTSSPVQFLTELYRRGRHLEHELRSSPAGEALGVVGL